MKINELLKKRPTLSFEIFPPKNNENDITSIYATIDELAKMNPDFISVTYGANGSTSKNTCKIASTIKNKYGIESVAHLTCMNNTKDEIKEILEELKENGIENVLSLRGDYPKDSDGINHGDFKYASELNEFIEENFPACPNVSIDFGIMEKADNVYVSLGDFGWSDLGTWGSLYDLSERDREGNVTLKSHSLIYNGKDNMIVLPKGKLAVIDGLEGYLIAESDNVLLICRKDEEHAIRKYVNDAQMQLGDDFI